MPDRPSLLLAAFPPELGDLLAAPPAGWRVACTGVGAITAAVTTARLLGELAPSRVLFVGTCGALDERLAVGDKIWASDALAISLDVLDGRSYRPEVECIRWPATLSLHLPFQAHSVAVPPGVTRTVEGARRLGTLTAVEHLELTGVYAACAAAGVPCGAVLGVANRVGPEAHREWLTNHEVVSHGLLAALRELGLFD